MKNEIDLNRKTTRTPEVGETFIFDNLEKEVFIRITESGFIKTTEKDNIFYVSLNNGRIGRFERESQKSEEVILVKPCEVEDGKIIWTRL